jgi:hypothetical protein
MAVMTVNKELSQAKGSDTNRVLQRTAVGNWVGGVIRSMGVADSSLEPTETYPMSVPLAEALRDVDLEPGEVYQCTIGNLRVEVRVGESSNRVASRAKGRQPSPYDPSDLMLDPWTDFPSPHPLATLTARPAKPRLPDAPEIPTEIQS